MWVPECERSDDFTSVLFKQNREGVLLAKRINEE
jgi:hypothetical protein